MSKCSHCETTGVVGLICDKCRIKELEAKINRLSARGIEDMQYTIAQLEAELETHRWTPVEEGLPEGVEDERTPYFVRTADYFGVALWREYDDGWDWECDCGDVMYYKLAHLPTDEAKGEGEVTE